MLKNKDISAEIITLNDALASQLIFITQGTFLTDSPSYIQALFDLSGSCITLFHVSLVLIGAAIESPKRKPLLWIQLRYRTFTLQ
jgi:hypothetical protein